MGAMALILVELSWIGQSTADPSPESLCLICIDRLSRIVKVLNLKKNHTLLDNLLLEKNLLDSLHFYAPLRAAHSILGQRSQ